MFVNILEKAIIRDLYFVIKLIGFSVQVSVFSANVLTPDTKSCIFNLTHFKITNYDRAKYNIPAIPAERKEKL